MATMGQKSSLPQLAPSVSQALMPDKIMIVALILFEVLVTIYQLATGRH